MSDLRPIIEILEGYATKVNAAIAALRGLDTHQGSAVTVRLKVGRKTVARATVPAKKGAVLRGRRNARPTASTAGEPAPARRRLPGRQKFTDAQLLAAIEKAKGLSRGDVAKEFQVTEPAAGRRLALLVADGVLVKGADLKYRRAAAATSLPAVN